MMRQATYVLVFIALIAAPGSGLSIRAKKEQPDGTATSGDVEIAGPGLTPLEIQNKWASMDDFLGIMFSMACKWYHGKNLRAEAAEKLNNGELTQDNFEDFIEKKHQQGMDKLNKACGMIVANGKNKCRSACIDRWGSHMQERTHCDESCLAVYDKFGPECQGKADLVQHQYENQKKSMAMKKQCYTGWCKDLPNVWMQPDNASMAAEVTTSCTRQCTASVVKNSCQESYATEVDFLTATAATNCHSNNKVMECYNNTKLTSKSEYESCSYSGNATCDSEFNECKVQAQTDNSPQEALSFCQNRFKQCGIKVESNCQDTYLEELSNIKVQCENDEKDRMQTCVSDTLAANQTSFMTKCQDDKSKTCEDDCRNNCKYKEMDQCLKETQSKDGTEEVCQDMWNMMTKSSEVDPMTGDPIVMLAPKGHTSKTLTK